MIFMIKKIINFYKLLRLGPKYEAIICPFHTEKTGSCMVSEDDYYCFGCGKKGSLPELNDALKAAGRPAHD